MVSNLKVDKIQSVAGTTTAITIDSSGVTGFPANPILKIGTTSDYTSQGSDNRYYVQNLTNAMINRGGFTVASTNGGRITIPKTGIYSWQLLTTNNVSSGNVRAYAFYILKNGLGFTSYQYHATSYQGSGTTHDIFTLIDTLELNANDYLEFAYRIYDNNTNVTIRHTMHLHWLG